MINTKSKAGYTRVKPKDFSMIKALQEAGLSINKSAKITGRAGGTIKKIYTSNTLDEYHQSVHADWEKYKSSTEQKSVVTTEIKPVEKKDQVKVLYESDLKGLYGQLNSILFVLKAIENKLPEKPVKKGWF